MKTLKLLLLVLFANIFVVNAQIGYQVSLLDSATGEPRANETVSCEVTLTDAEGTTVYSGSQSATSNDFGVVSLTVGNANTFEEMDWTKLPLFIEVSVDGKLIGKSQVLSVPVAECAKTVAPNKKIFGTWHYNKKENDDGYITTTDINFTINEDMSCRVQGYWEDYNEHNPSSADRENFNQHGFCLIMGDFVKMVLLDQDHGLDDEETTFAFYDGSLYWFGQAMTKTK